MSEEEVKPETEEVIKLLARNRELIEIHEHQASRLALMDTKCLALERINGLQHVLLKHAGPHLDMEALFKAWAAYLSNGGKIKDNKEQSRADAEAAQPQNRREMYEHYVRRLRQEIGELHQVIKEREVEIENLKSPAPK